MSSTNRSDARKRHISDYYVTPVREIVKFLKEFEKVEPHFREKIPLLDPCSGGDKENPMSYPMALKEVGFDESEIFTVDIREDSRAEVKMDYLSDFDMFGDEFNKGEKDFQMIITNPPFLYALDIIKKALEEVKNGGFVVMLLRLNFLGSKQRKGFWDEFPPKYIFVHHKRLSFTKDNRSDSIEYAHFVWEKGVRPEFSMLKVI